MADEQVDIVEYVIDVAEELNGRASIVNNFTSIGSVAKMLGVNLIIVRRGNKVTEGPTVSINYVSGSSNRIQTMSLSKKSIKKNSKCIFIDDFMKAGGTAIGIIDLLKEFDSNLVGIGVLIDNVSTIKKLREKYVSIVQFKGIGEDGNPIISGAIDEES